MNAHLKPREICELAAADPGDADLLAVYAVTGDPEAFAALVRRHARTVLGACRRVLADAHAAEDAFQATFLQLARKAGGLRHPSALPGWLYRTARRTALRHRPAPPPVPPDPPPARDPLDVLTARELLAAVEAEIARLPRAYRLPLVLCYLDGLPRDAAADRLGVPPGVFRGRLDRGRERLRAALTRRGLAPAAALGAFTPAPVAADLVARTVGVCAKGERASAAVAALAAGRVGLPTTTGLAVGLLVVLGGLALVAAPAQTDPPPPPASPQPRTDLFGDPLPDGAVLRLGTTRSRASIAGFGVAADGSIVTTSAAGEVGIWSLKGARPADGGRAPVRASDEFDPRATVSPDGRLVAANTRPERVVVWERAAGGFREVASFAVSYAYVLRFSPDGTQLAAFHHGLRLCDLRTGRVHDLDGSGVEAVAFSGDGTRLAATTGYGVDLWDTRGWKRLARYGTGRVRYTGVALNRAGTVLAVSPTWDPETVVFVDPMTGAAVPGLAGPAGFRCLWVHFAPGDRMVLLGDQTGVTWWDPVAGRVVRRYEGAAHGWAGGWNHPARFSPDGQTLVGVSPWMLLRWDAGTGTPLLPAAHDGGHQLAVAAAAASADGRWVATGGSDSRVRVWDARTGRQVRAVPTGRWGAQGVELGADGRFVYGPGPGDTPVTKWEVATGRAVTRYEFSPAAARRGSALGFRLSPDGRTLDAVSGPYSSGEPTLRVRWDAESGARLTEEPMARAGLEPPVLSPDGRWAATDAALYPVGAGPTDNRLPAGRGGSLHPGTFTADGRLIARATSGRDDPGARWRVVIFEVTTGAEVVGLPLGAWWSRLAFHPGGRSLAMAGDQGLAFYDLATGKPFAERKAGGNVRVVRYFPDGTRLVTGHEDTTALVWESPAIPKTARPLDDPGRAAAWDALIAEDGAKGWAAVWALADDPGAAGFLRTKVRPVAPLPAAEFTRLLADLGAADFATREAAEKALRNAGDRAAGQLRSALAVVPSAEQRARLGRLVGALPGPDARPTGEQLRAVRAVASLELAGSAEARRLLAELAAGAADATLTREAASSVARAGR